MARLVGIAVLIWAIYASIGFAVTNAPQPAAAAVSSPAEQPSLVDAISDAVPDPVIAIDPVLAGPTWAAGVYAVGDSPNSRIAARDRDYRPRTRLFVTPEATSDDDDDDDDDDEAASGGSNNGRNNNGRNNNADDEEPEDVDADERKLVQGEITPGLYATSFETEDCSYELWRVLRNREPTIIAEEYLASGRLLVTINGIEPDWFTSSDSCGEWREWTPQPEPLTMAVNGDYWLGDLTQGTWLVPRSCRWEKVVGFRGGFLYDVTERGHGPGAMNVDSDTYGLRVRGCREPMTLSSITVDLGNGDQPLS